MERALNVLLLESEPGAAIVAQHELQQAGHKVHYCHDPQGPAFPCNALVEGRGCPLDGQPIDVVVDVRRHHRSTPTVLEDGVSCALRQHVPIVVSGALALNPYEGYASVETDENCDVVEACERAASAPLEPHTAAAGRALAEVLERRNLPLEPVVTVRRDRGTLVISVKGAEDLDTSTKSMAATRMCGAVRAIDRYAGGVDVSFVEAAPGPAT